jgi:hypothetical protein
MKKLKKYNGDLGGTEHGVIAAYSATDAVQLINAAGYNMNMHGFRSHWVSGLWGNSAEEQLGVDPTERGLWVRGINAWEHPYEKKS